MEEIWACWSCGGAVDPARHTRANLSEHGDGRFEALQALFCEPCGRKPWDALDALKEGGES